MGDDPSAVTANRASLGKTQFMNQVHGDVVVVIDHLLDYEPRCDALITTNKDVSLAVMVADCIPLLLISEKAVAAVHVGRAGLVNKVALKALHQILLQLTKLLFMDMTITMQIIAALLT